MTEITVKEWVDSDDYEDAPVSIGGMGGWFKEGNRWDDYIKSIPEHQDPYAEAIRASVIKNEIKIGGDEHQDSADGTPLFSDGTVGAFSYRAWGDIMAAIWSEHEDKDYKYVDFYMRDYIG